jgi:hypothetical protein
VGRAARAEIARYLLTSLVGAACGFGWGWHLAGQPHPPKLLWVSIALGIGALLRSRRIAKADDGSVSFPAVTPWREALASPRRWPAERWRDFAVLNAAIAAGVLGGFAVG